MGFGSELANTPVGWAGVAASAPAPPGDVGGGVGRGRVGGSPARAAHSGVVAGAGASPAGGRRGGMGDEETPEVSVYRDYEVAKLQKCIAKTREDLHRMYWKDSGGSSLLNPRQVSVRVSA